MFTDLTMSPEERERIHEEVSKMTPEEVMVELFGPNWREEQAALREKDKRKQEGVSEDL